MKIAIITLSREGARIAARLSREIPGAEIFVHEKVRRRKNESSFGSILKLTQRCFSCYEGLIYIAPCGVVVRAIAPMIRHKATDPAVVVVDAGGRYAISLLSGHEGGANDLAFKTANIIGADPVVSTTTEAVKTLIVGIGCRRGAESKEIVAAIRAGLRKVQARVSQVRVLASAEIKKDEKGLIAAAEELGLSLRFVPSDEIASTTKKFCHSKFVASKVNLPAVAEPAALLAGRRTRLILPKSIIHGVTVAIARECCM
ncbi:MAG: cobalamin biosynthesis protein [Bacteroidota bacterium]|nr:cobalamin biosynthesis protein [Bacteroidota bacterium]